MEAGCRRRGAWSANATAVYWKLVGEGWAEAMQVAALLDDERLQFRILIESRNQQVSGSNGENKTILHESI